MIIGESDLDSEDCLGFLSSVALAQDKKWHNTHSGRFHFHEVTSNSWRIVVFPWRVSYIYTIKPPFFTNVLMILSALCCPGHLCSI